MAFLRKSESPSLGWQAWNSGSHPEPWSSTVPYRRILAWLQIRPGEMLLDLGSASGRMLEYATRMDVRATGLEFSPQAAAMAQKSASEAVVFIGSMDELPFENESFHCVTSLGLPSCIHSPQQHLREIRRVLKPKGKACFLLSPRATEAAGLDHTGDMLEGLGQPSPPPSFGEWENWIHENGYLLRGVWPEEHLYRRQSPVHVNTRAWALSWHVWWWRTFPRWHRDPFVILAEKGLD